ncbi:excalibur calcium-binding domain-containing protein [Nocardia sp. NPDC051787]|uniref:excalibur calcium-binding domain-containing protein n=1 Tax=Nocardia sp. NPDC051787 TaxID=3155415 RepID=UPI00343CF57E
MIAVLVLSMRGCKSKKRRHSTSSRPAATSTAPQQRFRDCAEAWAAGKAPVRRSDPRLLDPAGSAGWHSLRGAAGRRPWLIIVRPAYPIGSAVRTRPARVIGQAGPFDCAE